MRLNLETDSILLSSTNLCSEQNKHGLFCEITIIQNASKNPRKISPINEMRKKVYFTVTEWKLFDEKEKNVVLSSFDEWILQLFVV